MGKGAQQLAVAVVSTHIGLFDSFDKNVMRLRCELRIIIGKPSKHVECAFCPLSLIMMYIVHSCATTKELFQKIQ